MVLHDLFSSPKLHDGTRESAYQYVPDDASDACLRCNAHFTLFYRRHHCRNCGALVCWDCLARVKTENGNTQVARVCQDCESLPQAQWLLGGATVGNNKKEVGQAAQVLPKSSISLPTVEFNRKPLLDAQLQSPKKPPKGLTKLPSIHEELRSLSKLPSIPEELGRWGGADCSDDEDGVEEYKKTFQSGDEDNEFVPLLLEDEDEPLRYRSPVSKPAVVTPSPPSSRPILSRSHEKEPVRSKEMASWSSSSPSWSVKEVGYLAVIILCLAIILADRAETVGPYMDAWVREFVEKSQHIMAWRNAL